MEELYNSITKVLAHNIVVHVYSLPNFSIECFVTSLICVVHILLIVEVNYLVCHITEKSIAKMKRQRIMKDDSKPSSLISLQSGGTYIKMQRHLRKYYESHSPFLPPNTKKLITMKKNEMSCSEYNWMPVTVEEEIYEKIDHILSVSPSEYVKKDKEKKIHENELRNCLKSLTILLECSVASKMSSTSLAKSISLIRDHLETTMSSDNITENNRKITESLFDMMQRSLIRCAKKEEVTSDGDGTFMGNSEGNFSICSSLSDLDSQSILTEVK